MNYNANTESCQDSHRVVDYADTIPDREVGSIGRRHEGPGAIEEHSRSVYRGPGQMRSPSPETPYELSCFSLCISPKVDRQRG